MKKYQSQAEIFIKQLDFLTSAGYEGPQVTIEHSDAAGDSLSLSYSCSKAGRILEISYSSPDAKRPGVIVVVISNSQDDDFFLEDWLQANPHAGEISWSTTEGTSSNEEHFISKFCRDFRSVCEKGFLPVITGEVWPEIDFDWGSTR